MKNFFEKYEIIKLCFVLCLITSVTGLLLGGINGVTAPLIADIQLEMTNNALGNLLPDADNFEEQTLASGTDERVLNYYIAKSGEETVGYSVKVAPVGFGGPIEMIVSFDLEGKVVGTEIVDMAETPGLGTKIVDNADFAPQYVGKSAALTLVKSAASSDTEIVAITGATVSSSAMTDGVNVAISFLQANK